jgi:hypothetical protein
MPPPAFTRTASLLLALAAAAPIGLRAEEPRIHGTLTAPDGVQKIVLLDRDVPHAPIEKEVKVREVIERHFYGMKQFYNQNRILAICGNDKSAAALVELCRTTGFVSGKGEVIWRIERWDYANEWGAWQPRGTRVFRRYRWDRAQWEGIRWYFVPDWGGLTPGVEPLKLTMPNLAQTPGRYPGVAKGEPGPAPEAPPRKKHEEDLESQKDPDLVQPEE